MYGKCGNLNAARNLFCKMPQRNVVSWNSIITAFAQNGHCEMALELYSQMELEGVKPDKITFIGILDACSSLAAVKKGKEIHASISKHGYESDVFVGTALVDMYGRCGSLTDASSVFYKIPQRNIVLWTAMIAAYIHTGHDRGAIDLFRQMDLEGLKPDKITFISILDACSNLAALRESKEIHANIIACGFQSDIVLGNTLISMYGKCGSLEDAKNVFDNLPLQNVVSWNAMITAYAQNGHGKMALELFRDMDVECVKSDQIAFVSILDACAGLTALGEGKAIHANIVDGGFESDVVGNALVNMYGKCGSLADARSVFDKMPHHNVVSWNSMISVYAQNGNGKAALELFPLMGLEGVKPDNITFIGILSACSHTGLLDDGCYQFISMSRDHLITPRLDHYVCMIDLLGRAGQFNEAEGLINSIPFEPHPVLWINLLGTCRIHGDVERGAQAAEHAFELDPNNTAVFVLLSNIYAAAGRWGDVAKVRNVMEDRRVKKQPGCSSIEIKGRVHKFIVRDTSHPQKEMIYAELQRLTREMEKAGYVPDSKALLHDVNEGKKEHMLYYHSEKLAIAFGFIVTPPGFPLHVIKNLRVCSDCHSAIKLISKIARRKITVRDASRFHHFDNGVCSCKDYW